MKKLNSGLMMGALKRARRPIKRVRIYISEEESWTAPIQTVAARLSPRSRILRLEPQRIEISLLRSITLAGLRPDASHWGR